MEQYVSGSSYNLYEEDILQLVASMSIKDSFTARAINLALGEDAANDLRPEDFKYYMNLAGIYHHTDEMMTIVSVDTLETIDFTVANLNIHRATRREYSINSTYYLDLVERYPSQLVLIEGIIHPGNLEAIVAAPDYTIVSWNEALVEPWEASLINDVQVYINAYVSRAVNAQYQIIDDLMPAEMLSKIFSFLPAIISTVRLKYCMTSEVHSFHVWEHLASNGKFDSYRLALTRNQALFLYKNIEYLMYNAGKNETFELVLKHILTDRLMPLLAYDMRHNILPIELQESLYPIPEYRKYTLNGLLDLRENNLESIEGLTLKQVQLAIDNKNRIDDTIIHTEQRLLRAQSNNLPTKVLECNVIDTSGDKPYTYMNLLLNNWIYLAAQDRYVAILQIPNPYSGDNIRLNARDAYITFIYLYMRVYHNTVLKTVPSAGTWYCHLVQKPTFVELRKEVSDLIPDQTIHDLLAPIPESHKIVNSFAFNEYVQQSHEALTQADYIVSLQVSEFEHMALTHLRNRTIDSRRLTLLGKGDNPNYYNWFSDLGLTDIQELSIDDSRELIEVFFKHATGTADDTSVSLAVIHRAMLDIMERLNNYDLQFIGSTTSSSRKSCDWAMMRPSKWIIPMTIDHNNKLNFVQTIYSELMPVPKQEFNVEMGTQELVLESNRGYKFYSELTNDYDLVMADEHFCHEVDLSKSSLLDMTPQTKG